MESRNFVKCLFGGVALGGATTYFLSVIKGKQNEPYYKVYMKMKKYFNKKDVIREICHRLFTILLYVELKKKRASTKYDKYVLL